jgi:Bacterial Ig-like domain (group 3)/FG-GAP-like repeat
MTRPSALRPYIGSRRLWRRASLFVLLSVFLVATAQNPQTPQRGRPPSRTETRFRGAGKTTLRGLPSDMRIPPNLHAGIWDANGLAATSGAQFGLFLDAPQYPGGFLATYTAAVAVGDFNGDGKPDLVAVPSGVSVLLGNGDGTFQSPVTYSTGSYTVSVATGDFNGDGKPDLAVGTCGTTCSVSVLLGNGDGTFRAHLDYATGIGPNSVSVGDFNGDGKLDLVTANITSGTVSVLLGNGDGTFQAHIDYAAGSPNSVAVGDFNGDGKPDLVTVNEFSDTISVFLGKGDGTFQAKSDYPAGSFLFWVAVGDFNGDGKLDVVVVNFGGDTVSILLGNGDGTFRAPVASATGFGPRWVAVGDFNGDGKPDLVTANYGANTVSLLLGKGDGTFEAHVDYVTGYLPGSAAVADFNGDGQPDCVTANSATSTVSVLLGDGNGTLQAVREYNTGGSQAVAAGDFNRDGRLDLVTANAGNNTLSVLLSNGDGTFQTSVEYATAFNAGSVVVADFNRDGNLDVAVTTCGTDATCHTQGSISILLGNGDGTFRAYVDYTTLIGASSVSTADFNADGKPDLVVANIGDSSVSVLLGNGDGTFQAHREYATGGLAQSVAVGDFNGDGKLDLAVATCGSDMTCQSPGSVSILLGNGDGTFRAHADHATDYSATLIAAADFNRDGKLDVTLAGAICIPNQVGCTLFGSVDVLLGNGDGTLQSELDSPALPFPSSLTVGDFNSDGFPDVEVTNSRSTVSLYLGNGDGTLQTPTDYEAGDYTAGAVVGDFNADGALDLAVANYGQVGILFNLRGTSLNLQSSANPAGVGQSISLTTTIRAGRQGVGIATPTGTVTFVDRTTKLGSATVSASGVATFSIATLTAGTHSITAVYSGDSNFNPQTSVALSQVVTDFGLSSTPGNATVSPGTPVDFTVTATAKDGFNSSILLTCSVSPTPALRPTCALSPTSVAPAANGSATSKLTVSTIAPTASLTRPALRHGWQPQYGLWLSISGFALLGAHVASYRSRKKKLLGLLPVCLLVAVAGLPFQAACGGGSPGTAAGNYTVTVNAASGSTAHTISVTLKVK